MKAFKLINTPDHGCDFLEGTIPDNVPIQASYFVAQNHIDAYERVAHPAPRYQFVITVKGKLRFRVSSGSSFILEPGIMLIATDVLGEGHTWEMIEGDEWLRIYLVPPPEADDHFQIRKME